MVLLDEEGRDIGVLPKRLAHHADTRLHLAFSCYVFDTAGRLLVTQRAHHKKTWPGVWTNSCCGHPAPGEAIDLAVGRRLDDELGLSAGEVRLLLPRFRYRAVMPDGVVENEMCPVTMTVTDADPVPSADEVDGWEWVPWGEFSASVLSGDRAISPWCAEQVPLLAALGPDPLRWPSADPRELPTAAGWSPAETPGHPR
ncbi:isopentenyl-diphosphate Delta-isomerase [Actinorhabdospora filicis]|uniref:Isopentenyl-diphosphate Delta-isomerase n=1 Tax=Actinorhabdospora filicis TaxID=1785913 RepID=A0A9W6SQS1_9ACTN|nr:isopentenyl-diphosphate Delta-isomerase [Actinorhabdospora filicis]